MIAWGGVNNVTNLNTGGLYQPPIPDRGTYTGRVTITVLRTVTP